MSYRTGPKIVTDGLVLCLDAADRNSYPGSGSTWYDLSGNGNNLTLTNGPTFNTNNHGSFSFDGANDYVSSVSIPNPNGQLTCEVTMNYNSKGQYHNIFDRGSNRPMLWIDNNNKLEVSFPSANGGLTSTLAYHGQNVIVTAVYSSVSSPGIELYVNGVSVGTNATAHVSWANPSTFTLFNRAGGQTFSGKIYSFKFYNKVLTTSEISQNFEATKGRFGL